VTAFFAKLLKWAIANPLLVALIVLGLAFVSLSGKYAWDRNSWKAERAGTVVKTAALKTDIQTLQDDLVAAKRAAEGSEETIRIQKAELDKRDREDAARQKAQAEQVAKARAAAASAERVAQNALRQLEAASRRSPTCAALLNADIRKECGL
jgi:hypothetical protein